MAKQPEGIRAEQRNWAKPEFAALPATCSQPPGPPAKRSERDHFAEVVLGMLARVQHVEPGTREPGETFEVNPLLKHITDLRTALNEARAALGLSTLTFTDSTPVVIKAVHIHELRDGVR